MVVRRSSIVTLSAAALWASGATAQDSTTPRFAVHGQATFVVQGTPGFASPYAAANRLIPDQARQTIALGGGGTDRGPASVFAMRLHGQF